MPAELALHRVVGQVGDVADHARDAQAAPRHHAVRVVVAAVEVGVGDDGAARDLVEGDVLRRQVRRGGDRDAVAHPRRVAQRPGQRLHAAQAAADHRGQLHDAEPLEQRACASTQSSTVTTGKSAPYGRCVAGLHAHRPGAAETRTRVVDADDEEAVGVQRLAGADQVVPPAGAVGLAGVLAGDVVAGVQRVAHQHRVAARRVQRAVGLVDQRVVAQLRAAPQRQAAREVHRLWGDGTD